jgi:hypothetical protein
MHCVDFQSNAVQDYVRPLHEPPKLTLQSVRTLKYPQY